MSEKYVRKAKYNAVDANFAPLKIAIPCAFVFSPVVISYAGFGGLAGLIILGVGGIYAARNQSRKQWKRLDKGDKKLLYKLTDPDDREGLVREYNQERNAIALPPSQSSPQSQSFDVRGFLESVTSVAILGNSGSGKTTLAKYIAAHLPQNQILVLDPHADPNHPEYPWEGLTVVSKYGQILEVLEKVLALLDQKDRTPLTIICDEWPATRLYAKEQGSDIADKFLLRIGSEGRKFLKFGIFGSQSGNVKALGLEGLGDFLENFALVRLQKVALKHARTLRDQSIYQAIQTMPYPMLIGDSDLFCHPNFEGYKEIKKGNVPRNLHPLSSHPITLDILPYQCEPVREGHPPNHSEPVVAPVRTSSHQCSEPPEPGKPLTPNQREKLIEMIENGDSQNKICEEFFGVKKGSSDSYRWAVEQIKELRLQIEQDNSGGFNGLV